MTRSNSKILIISPAWVGDMVMSQVLLKLLKQQNPEAIIEVLAPAWAQSLLARMPEVAEVHVMPLGHGQLQLKQRWQLGRSLRAKKYTQAIVLPNSWKSALIPFAARIPQRTGWIGEFRWGLLNDVRQLDKKRLPLMIERFFALGLPAGASLPAVLPKPELQVTAAAVSAAKTKFQLSNSQPILALCPGAEYGPAKRWPAEYYAELAQQKLTAGWAVWLFGSVKDQVIAAEIQAQTALRCVDLTGRTTLGEAIDLLSLANVVVTNDSGLMHIAAALHRPIVALYGSSSPRFTPPLSDQVEILSLELACSPCFKRECPLEHLNCLRQLLPQQVLHAVDNLAGV